MDTNQSVRRVRSPRVEMARQMRRNATPAEHELWQYLRGSRLDGLRFRRQHPIAGLIVDFYCHALNLAVQVDRPVQDPRAACDGEPAGPTRAYGMWIVRVRSEMVLNNPRAALDVIRRAIAEVRGHRAPSPS